MTTLHIYATCEKCERVFDLLDQGESDAYHRGHDCETPDRPTCHQCGKSVRPLEVFPGHICIDCHAENFDRQPMPTAQDVTRMWGGVA